MNGNRQSRLSISSELAAPIVIAFLGALMFAMALTQPSWLGERIGPGLFARWLSAGVIAMSLVWLLAAIFQGDFSNGMGSASSKEPIALLPGIGLLAGVATFAIALPVTGLVLACALCAMVVSWGAGERATSAFLISGTAGAAAAVALGYSLLPPTIRLWPPAL